MEASGRGGGGDLIEALGREGEPIEASGRGAGLLVEEAGGSKGRGALPVMSYTFLIRSCMLVSLGVLFGPVG